MATQGLFTPLLLSLLLLGCGTIGYSPNSHAQNHNSALAALPPAPEAASSPQNNLQNSRVLQHRGGVCVTAHPLASQACQKLLNQGGSAIDGALAAAWMLGLVEPQSSGLGGGGYALYFDGKQVHSIDGRETAPKLATAQRFLDDQQQPISFLRAARSGLAVGTPSMVKLMQHMHQQFGQRPWSASLQPAIQRAQRGFLVSPRLNTLLQLDPTLRRSHAATLFYPKGQALSIGTRFKNPAYAQTLARLASHGADSFYQGELAKQLVQQATQAGSDLSLEDLAAYQVKVRAPLCLSVQQRRVCSMPPSSSGGIALLQTLAMLDGQWHDDVITNSTYFTNAQRLAFADRDAYVADPDQVNVPATALLDPNYLKQRQQLALTPQAIRQAQAGLSLAASSAKGLDAPNTSHISVVDRAGRAVSLTLSIESAFGSQIWFQQGGFFLNNQLTDFSFLAQQNGQNIANAVAAEKRPRSSMAPTLVLNAQNQVQGVLGSPGGSQIIGYVAQATWGLLNGQSVDKVLNQGHILRRGDRTELERGRFDEHFKHQLEQAGHLVSEGDMTSGLAIIWRGKNGQWIAGADPRREGTAVGQSAQKAARLGRNVTH